MEFSDFPKTQRELIRAARGSQTQTTFADVLGVDRTCLCRYESERSAAPASVINFCLQAWSSRRQATEQVKQPKAVLDALRQIRQAVSALETTSFE